MDSKEIRCFGAHAPCLDIVVCARKLYIRCNISITYHILTTNFSFFGARIFFSPYGNALSTIDKCDKIARNVKSRNFLRIAPFWGGLGWEQLCGLKPTRRVLFRFNFSEFRPKQASHPLLHQGLFYCSTNSNSFNKLISISS
jgi:hypothetical protein